MANKVSIRPISPKEAMGHCYGNIPSEVIDTWNKMIVKKLSNGTAVIRQAEIVKAICKEMSVKPIFIYAQRWLDIETLYRKRGWKVEYDKPGYNETYEPTFTFTME